MSNLTIAIMAIAALSTAAEAKPHTVVVVDFDGLPRKLADTGRSNVMSLLGDEYELVPTKKWESARADAPGRGPVQWKQAAKISGVDAVIEGYVNTEGRHHTLVVLVRDALTGNEINSVSIAIGEKGLSSESVKSLTSQLDDILVGLDPEKTHSIPPVPKETIGVRKKPKHVENDGEDGDVERHNDRSERDEPREHRSRDDGDGAHGERGTTRDFDDPDGDDVRRSDKDRANAPTFKATTTVAAADPTDVKNTSELQHYFGPDSEEQIFISAPKQPRVMTPTPKYFLEAGGWVGSRGMSFAHNPPDSVQQAPDYPAQGLAGISIQASVYPYPIHKLDFDPSGIGFSFGIQKSVGSLLSAYDPDQNTYGDYVIDNTAYNGAIHYRMPWDILVADGDISYGKFGYAIEGLGTNIPDVNYTYIGLGGTVDLKVTDRTRAGFGAHYMYLLDAGDVSDETWYGSGSASGIDLEAHFQIPISDMLYVRGMVDYRRVSMDFEQSGDVSSALEIGSITDSTIGGQLSLGVQFQ